MMRRRHVGADSHPDRVVGDEAVEDGAQEQLHVVVDRTWRQKQRVRRHDVGGHDGGDEREAVGRRGDVTIGQPRLLKVAGSRQARRCCGGDESAGSRDVDSEWVHVFAFDDREASPAVREK